MLSNPNFGASPLSTITSNSSLESKTREIFCKLWLDLQNRHEIMEDMVILFSFIFLISKFLQDVKILDGAGRREKSGKTCLHRALLEKDVSAFYHLYCKVTLNQRVYLHLR